MNKAINTEVVGQSAQQYAEAIISRGTPVQVTIEQAYLDGMEFALNMAIANQHAIDLLNAMKKD